MKKEASVPVKSPNKIEVEEAQQKQAQTGKGEDVASNQSLLEFTYEFFQNRYGLKNVADKKFTQFIGSILKFKDKLPRLKLAGRFLQLYDELEDCDLKLYIDLIQAMYKAVLNFTIIDQDEIVLIPLVSTAPLCSNLT